MAYGIKYKLSYCNANGTPLRIEILKNNFSGAAINIEGAGNPFNLKRLNDKGKEAGIIASEAVISLYEQSGFSLDDIYTSDEREYKVKFYYNNIIEWTGYLLPDYFSKEIDSLSVIELTAIDCIGTLKDVAYLNDNGTIPVGRQNLLTVVSNCLKKTDIILPLSVICDIICDEWESQGARVLNFLEDTYIHSERFSDNLGNTISRYDILKSIAIQAGCRVVQHSGKWWFENISQLESGTGNIDTFTLEGVRVGARVPFNSQVIDIDYVFSGGTQSIVPANGLTEIYSEHGQSFPLIFNTNFENFSGGSYPGWTNMNGYQVVDTFESVRSYNADGTIFASSTDTTPSPKIISNILGNVQTAPYMKSNLFSVPSGEKIQISLSVKGFPEDRLLVSVRAGDYFLQRDGTWSNDLSRITTIPLVLPEGTPDSRGKYSSQEQVFTITSQDIPRVGTGGFGDREVRIYGHSKGGDASKNQLTISGLNVIIVPNKDTETPKGIVFGYKKEGAFSKKNDIPTILFSDKVTRGVNGVISAVPDKITSLITTRLGNPTSLWKGNHSPQGDYLNMVTAKQAAISYGRASKALNISIEIDYLNFNYRYNVRCIGVFIATSCEIDYLNSIAKVTLNECVTTEESLIPLIYSAFESNKGSGIKGIGSVSGGGSAPQNLQSVTDIGPETDKIITAKGLRALDLLILPNKPSSEPFSIHVKDTGFNPDPDPGYQLPIASENILGGIRIGNGLTINPVTGVLTAQVTPSDLIGYARESWVTARIAEITAESIGAITQNNADTRYIRNQSILQVGASLFVESGTFSKKLVLPSIDSTDPHAIYVKSTGTGGGDIPGYVLPIASPTVLGGIKIGSGLSIDANGVVSVTGGGGGGDAWTKTQSDDRFVFKAGDEMTGTLKIKSPTGQKLLLQSATAKGNNFIELINNSGLRQGYMGFGGSSSDDFAYSIQDITASHQFYIGSNLRLSIKNDVVTSLIPFSVDAAFIKDLNSPAPIRFLTGGQAQGINIGQLLISNDYADVSKVPINGAFVKGLVQASRFAMTYPDARGITAHYMYLENMITWVYKSEATGDLNTVVHQFKGFADRVLLSIRNDGHIQAPIVQATTAMQIPNTPSSLPFAIYVRSV